MGVAAAAAFSAALVLLLPAPTSASWRLEAALGVDLYAVFGAGPGDLYAVGAKGALFRSKDGASWQRAETSTEEPLYAVWGGAGARLVVVGGGGVVLRSDDSGRTFRQATPFKERPTLRGLFGDAAGALYVVGDAGLIARSRDGGDSWQRLKSGTDKILHAVWGGPAGDLYAVGEQGAILRSRDGGDSWQPREGGTREILRGVWGSGEGVYAVGYGGVILYSPDRGESFAPCASATSEWLVAVRGAGPGEIYAVGARGVVLRAASPGGPFAPEESGHSQALYGIWVAGGEPGAVYLVGRGGAVLRREEPAALALEGDESTRGAEIFLDGAPLPPLPQELSLPAGRYTVEARRPGYLPFSAAVELSAGQRQRLALSLAEETASLRVEAGAGAEVFLDGVRRGASPLTLEGLRPGRHVVTAKKPGFQELSRELDLGPGEAALTLALSPLPAPAERDPRAARWLGAAAGLGALALSAAGLGLREAGAARRATEGVPEGGLAEAARERRRHQRGMFALGAAADLAAAAAIFSAVKARRARR